MDTIRYLAYGSNLHPARIGARLASVTAVGFAALPGWRLQYHKLGADGSGKCNLIIDPASVAYGAVYEISRADKSRLDEIEGVGNGYTTTTIALATVGDAWVYVAQQSHIDESLVPFDWYLDFVLHGALHHGLPERYVGEIRNMTSQPDPDAERRRSNRKILGR